MACGLLNNNNQRLTKEADCLARKLLPWKVLSVFYFFSGCVSSGAAGYSHPKKKNAKSARVLWPALGSCQSETLGLVAADWTSHVDAPKWTTCSISFDQSRSLIIESRPFCLLIVLHVPGLCHLGPPTLRRTPAYPHFNKLSTFATSFLVGPTRLLRNWIKCSRTEGQIKSQVAADCLTGSAASSATFALSQNARASSAIKFEYLSSR